MARKQVVEAIKAMGLRCKYIPETGEYRVAPNYGPFPGGRGFQAYYLKREEDGAYYTEDKEDALGTARDMVSRGLHQANVNS